MNIMPRYIGPLRVLLADDVLTVVCRRCDHRAIVEVRSLPQHIVRGYTVAEFETRMPCTSCGEHGHVELVLVEAKSERERSPLPH